jgi:hypothetical protein
MFGCACWPNLRPYNAHKLVFRSKRCLFLGYNNLHKGYKCLEPSSGQVYISRVVIFDEIVFPFASMHPNVDAHLKTEISLLHPTLHNSQGGEHIEELNMPNVVDFAPASFAETGELTGSNSSQNLHENSNATVQTSDPDATEYPHIEFRADSLPVATSDQAPLHSTAPDSGTVGGISSPRSSMLVADVNVPVFGLLASVTETPATEICVHVDDVRPRTRLQNKIRKPKTYTDGTVWYACLTQSGEPKNLEAALQDDKWHKAMNEEYQALLKNKTWHLVLSHHASNIIDCKWVYKIKRKQDGSMDRVILLVL